MRTSELSLDERGTRWKSIELTWNELDSIKEAIKLVEGLDSVYLRDKVMIRINADFVVEKTIDGVTVSFEDYEEPGPVDELLKDKTAGEVWNERCVERIEKLKEELTKKEQEPTYDWDAEESSKLTTQEKYDELVDEAFADAALCAAACESMEGDD